MKFILLSALGLLFLLGGCNNPQEDKGTADLDQKVDSLLAIMTLEEKIGQLNLPSAGDVSTGISTNKGIAKQIKEGKVGGLFNINGLDKIRAVQKVAVEESRLGIPLIIAKDVIHGYKTTFPIPIGLSASWDMELIEKSARIAAQEASADGIAWTFSPMTDISRDPRWGRVSEGSGEDPYLGAQIAKAMVKGYQGDDLSAANTLLACVKHFALYGASEAGRDYNTVDMGRLRMYNDYFPSYKAAVDAGVGTAMASFNEIDGVPATGNKWLMTDVLREAWGFDGFVVSDYTGVSEMIAHGMGDLQQVSALAINAGVEMDMVSEGFLTTLEKSVAEGKVSEATITNAARLILKAKFQLGLFDDPYRYMDEERASEIFSDENRAVARKVASESMVLLKNEDALPLRKDAKIALIGPLANNKENMVGTWSVSSDISKSISIYDGIKEVSTNPENVKYAKGSNLVADPDLEERIGMFGKNTYRDDRAESVMIAEAVSLAKNSDVVVAVLGEASESSGESSSLTDISIPEVQVNLLKALKATGKKVVVVLLSGRPLVLDEILEDSDAILNAWFPGSEAGLALADVLYGDVNPSGKLTMTYPQNVGQIPIYYAHKNTGRPLEGEWFQKFKSNYLDVSNEPEFPFGYGLSYTNFSYDNLKLSSEAIDKGGELRVTVEVSNTGNVTGKEVVQLYIRDLVGTVTRPVKELKGFQKIELKAGETKTVEFTLSEQELGFYHQDMSFYAEPGEFRVFVGTSSDEVLESEFELK
ncbi:glycosyl hydrolase [Marivirga tractuosa]|uniref:Periplasmic beta-glucosidase n=1 Tax=Marivirga tractuosa (strain ATCC 23168 / DSM 4126 / NBRC 15989 / NCIMB 1408 / VKM B-1430 / H-43) TaxID=643867 RepID=E4TS47_MARTH|nr:beta-glucosidase BglX [Marivirga tractuosa]ADR21787.1 glycoside hydrolase family 3 domain protein [Marivirga tractuosa DSM 4126]BDD13755.1 glycosyl hydrolase [Marivirga tractuosa]